MSKITDLFMPHITGIKIGAGLLLLTGCFYAGWHLARTLDDGVAAKKQVDIDKAVMAQITRNHDMMKAYQDKVKLAEVQNAQIEHTIRQLGDFIDGLQPPKDHIVCRSPVRVPAKAGSDTNGTTGLAIGGVAGYFAFSPRDRSRIIATYKRCADLNKKAINSNAVTQ